MQVKLLKFIPLGSGLIVLLSLVKNTYFFSHFNIPIMSYLNLPDLVTLLFTDIHTILIVSLIGVFHIIISNELYEIIDENTYEKTLIRIRTKLLFVFFFITVIMFSILYLELIKVQIWNIYLSLFTGIQFCTFFFLRERINKENSKELFISSKFLFTTCTLIIVISIFPLFAKMEVNKVENTKTITTINLSNGKSYSSNKSLLYIRKAGKNHFLFKDDEALIIEDSNVESVKIKNIK